MLNARARARPPGKSGHRCDAKASSRQGWSLVTRGDRAIAFGILTSVRLGLVRPVLTEAKSNSETGVVSADGGEAHQKKEKKPAVSSCRDWARAQARHEGPEGGRPSRGDRSSRHPGRREGASARGAVGRREVAGTELMQRRSARRCPRTGVRSGITWSTRRGEGRGAAGDRRGQCRYRGRALASGAATNRRTSGGGWLRRASQSFSTCRRD